MKGTKYIIGGLVLVGIGALTYFLIKNNGKGSKKEFILGQYKSTGTLNADELKKISDNLDKVGQEDLQTLYDFFKQFSEKLTPSEDLMKKSNEISVKYGLPS
jgi:hypothetical protein